MKRDTAMRLNRLARTPDADEGTICAALEAEMNRRTFAAKAEMHHAGADYFECLSRLTARQAANAVEMEAAEDLIQKCNQLRQHATDAQAEAEELGDAHQEIKEWLNNFDHADPTDRPPRFRKLEESI